MTVAQSITTTTRKIGESYRGMLKVDAPWGKYTRIVGAHRVYRQDAQEDADRWRNDYISINQLPE